MCDSPANSPAQPVESEHEPVTRADKKPKVDPKEMQIVPAGKFKTKPFKLPKNWLVEVKPRGPNSSVHCDKYYYEPGTGRKFRSLISIKRYLNGETDPPPMNKSGKYLVPYNDNSVSFKRVVYGGKLYTPDEVEEARYTSLDDIYPETLQFRKADALPDGWIVEEVPRKGTLRSDRYYIDPVTGQKFRSMPEVRRFLEEQRYRPKRKALTLENRPTAPRSSHTRKKNNSNKTDNSNNTTVDTLSDITNPPKKINWVYSGDSNNKWSPLLEECALPSYVTKQWYETFLLGMNGWKLSVPLLQLTMEESNQE